MTDKTYCTVTFTLQECKAIGVAMLEYGSKKLGVKFPPELLDSDFLEDFPLLKKSKRLEIYLSCFDEIQRGIHKAVLDARLEEMGHEDRKSWK